jgi:hypothetical protein
MSHSTLSAQPPSGWLSPSDNGSDYNVDSIYQELAAMDEEEGSEEYDHLVSFYDNLSDWELLATYRERNADY